MAETSLAVEPEAGAQENEARRDAKQAAAEITASARLIGTQNPDLAAFFAGFTRYASPEDLIHFSEAELAALVRLVFAHTKQREPGRPLIEILDPSSEDPGFRRRETLLLAVNDDMPFLYDSCTAEVRAQGLHVVAAFHPVIAVARDVSGWRRSAGTTVKESIIVLALAAQLSREEAERLRHGLLQVFHDVQVAVRDWKPMLARLSDTIAGLKKHPPSIPEAELSEALAFLGWLADNHFTFLGSRDYVFSSEGEGSLDPDYASGLGLLADPSVRVVRRGSDRAKLTAEVRDFLMQPSPLIIAKSHFRSKVHRRVHMDYIGIKTFDASGKLAGERRFIGLFTSTAYSQLPSAIPLLRRKIAHVMAASGLPAASHDGKALQHILDTFPRDELYQIGEDELLDTALGILNLGQRPKVKLFLRFDKFDRYVSALVFLPRERYSGSVRQRIHEILARAFNGRLSAAIPMLEDEALARIHYIVGRNQGMRPQADIRQLEAEIKAAIRTWEDGFAEGLQSKHGDVYPERLRRAAAAFPAGYRERFSPEEAVEDLARMEAVLKGTAPLRHLLAHVYVRGNEAKERLRVKLLMHGDFIALSECLPVFENLGLKVIAENAFVLTPTVDGETKTIAVQNFVMDRADGKAVDIERLRQPFEDAFYAVMGGLAESDGFNRLIVGAGLEWRDVSMLRAIAKFLRQTGMMLSQAYMETALAKNAEIAAQLVELFHVKHDPARFAQAQSRAEAARRLREAIEAALVQVPSADDDRILRSMLAVVDAMLRTSFYQPDARGMARPYLAFKLDSQKLDLLPEPRPLYEIFVYSPEVEAVHLRFGKVARGGIRWSDRAEDFRTEILSLVKAQQVKNAVIVPVGAKGGFYVKRLAPNASRDAVQAAGIAAYTTFIGALLDLTDNIGADGTIVPPSGVLRYDGDDPYLVIAADKGTATFSDIANGLALARNYWLGDAFASGGSHGYDHKKMGITARGAWEAVKRHFRELGRDIQTEAFTCIGVGDMSGDVFGNAMLLSKEIKLLAAFDHRHIFIDPAPDPHAAWAERRRLFELPRSSWADYDAKLIAPGGGVFSRTAKDIVLSKEMKALTGLTKDRATPQEIIRALLAAEVDLLFFGGIGTFVKASSESHADVGDRANDSLRVDGREVRALVVGEGANLGVTQLGRVEYAREGSRDHQGGRINTDAIDNSAGVDTSDHEVNIKILMNGPLRRGDLTLTDRDHMLAAMTEEVASLVLENNYDQTLALSVAELFAARDLDAAGRLMRELERAGRLDRQVERLPDDDALKRLQREGLGLTRPQNAVLLAYAKLELFDAVVASDLPTDPYFAETLTSYFPKLAAARFADEIPRHRLAREIVATRLANRTVNLAGPLFGHRMRELSNAPLWLAARAFALADGTFKLETLKQRICALDRKVPAALQNVMIADIAELLRRLGLWFIVQLPATADLGTTIKTYNDGFIALKGRFSTLVSPLEAQSVEARIASFRSAGIPQDLADDCGIIPILGAVPEIILLAGTQSVSPLSAAGAYFAIGALVGLDRLRRLAADIKDADHWDRLALRRIVDDLYSAQRLIAEHALSGRRAKTDHHDGMTAAKAWAEREASEIARTLNFLDELERGAPTIAKLALANSQIQKLAGKP